MSPRVTPLLPLALLAACATSGPGTRPPAVPSAAAGGEAAGAITEADLRRDLFALAGDEMRGREAGTLDELRASAWVAERAREAGLQPAGDDGTYFQFWPMRRVRTAASSRVAIGGAPLALGTEAVVLAPVNATVDLPLVWVGEGQ